MNGELKILFRGSEIRAFDVGVAFDLGVEVAFGFEFKFLESKSKAYFYKRTA